MWPSLLLSIALLACGTPPEAPAPGSAPADPEAPAARPHKAGKAGKAGPGDLIVPEGDDPDVVLAILDTVRADHTSLCGYERPTTPFLSKLVADFGAVHTCEAYTPGAWTLPSHATYFTGVLLPEHHYDSMNVPDWSNRSTLADQMAARGYSTVLVTANPVLTKARGLAKGFELVLSAEEIDAWRGEDVANRVKEAMGKVDPSQPMFLVVNIMDAHDPYPRIPAKVGWVGPQPRLDFKVKDRDTGHPYHQYLQHTMTPEDEAAFLQGVVNGYDYGLSQADEALKAVLGVLARRGRVAHGMRLVVTSDHGEFLGEHHLLRHGGWLWEPVVKVPLLVVDTRPDHSPPDLPEGPFSAAHVFDLLRDGVLPTPLRDVVAFSSKSNFAENPGSNSVGMWSPEAHKLVWTREASQRFDLTADPLEAHPLPPDDHPLVRRIAPYVQGYKDQVAWRESQHASPDDLAALEALGYVEKAAE